MMPFLQFAFSSFWHFVGVWILLIVLGNVVIQIIRAIAGIFKNAKAKL